MKALWNPDSWFISGYSVLEVVSKALIWGSPVTKISENNENARFKSIIDFDYALIRPVISIILSWLIECSCF